VGTDDDDQRRRCRLAGEWLGRLVPEDRSPLREHMEGSHRPDDRASADRQPRQLRRRAVLPLAQGRRGVDRDGPPGEGRASPLLPARPQVERWRPPNAAADADLPTWRLEERRLEVRAPEAHEVQELLAAAETEDVRIAVFLRVLAATGMRRGEACALRWSDLDLDHCVLTVDEAVVTAKGGVTVKGPKTRASIRSLACDERKVALLSALQTEQQRLANAAGDTLRADAFVFSAAPGGALPPHPDAMSHALSRIRDRAGLPDDIHLHSLRHFHATALDPVISEAQKQARLGWSTVHMARHYTDGVAAEDRRAAEHSGRLLD
jgi:integrase